MGPLIVLALGQAARLAHYLGTGSASGSPTLTDTSGFRSRTLDGCDAIVRYARSAASSRRALKAYTKPGRHRAKL